ncbi:MAG TPA: c-type cytochrome [Acidimicrobiales bacterium]|jgi:ubiquinol-cytochrome c reductase cytochrome c subunit|nr:c-type cytochrome [Acidimicrobiales bacterium]
MRALSPHRQTFGVVAVVFALTGVVLATIGGRAAAQSSSNDDLVAEGRALYNTGCVSCHGPDGQGVVTADGEERGPSLETAGEAGAYYQLATGRMPLNDPHDEPVRKRPAYDDHEIQALVAYVATLGNGPALPQIDLQGADVAAGGELFRANCAPCHSASGAGGALSYGAAAPPLSHAQPLQVAAAVRSGPGQMPVFGPDVFDDEQLRDLAAYVEYLRHPHDPGGVPIGRTGPVPEGFVAWFFGMGALVAFVAWIGTRAPLRRRRSSEGAPDA